MTEHKPWLSLPDEDPPERGLAELMAAARMKAEIMANPPWWKRVLELLRRPPVLALATVIVLIGGVIIVHREPPEMSSPAGTSGPECGVLVPAEPGGMAAHESPPPVEHRVEKPDHAETKALGKAPDHAETSKVARPDFERLETGTVQVDLAPKREAQAVKQVEEAPIVDDAVNQPNDGESVQTGGVAKQTTQKGRTPTPSESLVRCRTAAANKDCANARACAKQIEAASPQFYKANVANDATLKPCL